MTQSPQADLQDSIQALGKIFAEHFPVERSGPRLIGREAEYPVVGEDGEAFDVQTLWPLLLEGGGKPIKEGEMIVGIEGVEHTFSLEVGWGTMEIISRPCKDLHELKGVMDKAMEQLLGAATQLGGRVLGYGIQPKTPATEALMSPKSRYSLLHDRIGELWLWFTSTSSDQLHVDLSRGELVTMLNFANMMSPVSIALCANSPIYGGEDHGFCSSRESQMKQIFSAQHRHGMPARPVKDIADWIGLSAEQVFLMRKQDGVYTPQDGPFSEYLKTHGADFAAFLDHDHYLWNSARARTAHGTIEFRSPCQQPWSEHMSAATLGLALIEAAPSIVPWLEAELGDDAWSAMEGYHHDVILKGLDATEPFSGLLKGILERCEEALEGRGLGEATLMKPLWSRLESRKNPAQRARDVFEKGGLPQLLQLLSIPPAS